MKVLWVCNIMPPIIGQYLGKECSVKEGWISGILARLAKEKEEIELGICYPVAEQADEEKKVMRERFWTDRKKNVPYLNIKSVSYSERQMKRIVFKIICQVGRFIGEIN